MCFPIDAVHKMSDQSIFPPNSHIFTSFESVHLGGGKETTWVIDCDEAARFSQTDILTSVEANGGDIFLCNARLNKSCPRPLIDEGETRNVVWIYYLAET